MWIAFANGCLVSLRHYGFNQIAELFRAERVPFEIRS